MIISTEQYDEMESRLATMTNVLGYIVQGMMISINKSMLEEFLNEYGAFNVCTMEDKGMLHVWIGKADEQAV